MIFLLMSCPPAPGPVSSGPLLLLLFTPQMVSAATVPRVKMLAAAIPIFAPLLKPFLTGKFFDAIAAPPLLPQRFAGFWI